MSTRPFPLDGILSRPEQAPLRLRERVAFVVFSTLLTALAGYQLLQSRESLFILLGVLGTVAGFAVLFLAYLGGYEWVRRRHEDECGFRDFVDAGGPFSFPAMLAAFEGQAPDHPRLYPLPSRAEVTTLGTLRVDSGLLVFADPAFLEFAEDLAEALEERIPAGDWPLDAVVLHYADGSRRVAALRLRWDPAPVVYFNLGWTATARMSAQKTRTLPRFGIDSGTACLATVEARDLLVERRPAQFWEFVTKSWPAGQIRFDGGVNLFVFPAGAGEGNYPCFFGKSTDGRTVAFYVDFGLIGQEQRLDPKHLPVAKLAEEDVGKAAAGSAC